MMLRWISSVPPAMETAGTETRISAIDAVSRAFVSRQHRFRAGHQSMHVRCGPRDVAGGELTERAFRTLRTSLLLGSARTTRGPFCGFRQDHQLGDLLAHVGIRVRAGFFGSFDDEVDAAGALRIPLIGLISRFEFGALFRVNPSGARDALGRCSQSVGAAALVRESRHRDLPAIADASHEVFRRDLRVGEKHLVERRVAVHLFERLDVNAWLLDVDHEIRQPLVLRHVPISAGEQQAVVGVMGTRSPHLLSVDDPIIALQIRARGGAGQVGTAAGLAEELAPGCLRR